MPKWVVIRSPNHNTTYDWRMGLRVADNFHLTISPEGSTGATNVGLEHMIGHWEAGRLGLVETVKLNMRLRRRLKAYYSSKGFIESLGLVWPARYAQNPRNMQFLHDSKQISSTWFVIEGPLYWLVPCCCVANSVLDAG
jgi:hypothetical protein